MKNFRTWVCKECGATFIPDNDLQATTSTCSECFIIVKDEEESA